MGCIGKGAAAPLPLPPRCRRDEWVSLIILFWTDWIELGLFATITMQTGISTRQRRIDDDIAECGTGNRPCLYSRFLINLYRRH